MTSTAQYKQWVAGTSTYGIMELQQKLFLSVYFTESKQWLDITNKDISVALKRAATILDYPTAKGIPIN